MARTIFVSYNFKDYEVARTVKSMTQNNGGKIDGKFVFVENDVSVFGDKVIENEIRKVMNQCDAVLFVIGDDSHNSPWINREAQLAKSLGRCVVVTNLPNSYGGVPHELVNTRYTHAEWTQRDLAIKLNQC